MHIIITGKNFHLSEANKKYVSDKMDHMPTYDNSIRRIKVEVDADKKERDHEKIRVEVWVDGENPVKAGSHGLTLFEAVDGVAQKLKSQLVKQKERKRGH